MEEFLLPTVTVWQGWAGDLMQHTPLGYCCRDREKGLTIYQLHNVLGRAISNQNSTHVSIVCVPSTAVMVLHISSASVLLRLSVRLYHNSWQ